MTRFFFCRLLLQDWERWWFHPLNRNHHREPRKMRGMMKPQEKTLNKMEVSDLSDEEFKTMIIKVLLNTGKEWAHTVITSNGSYRTKEYTRGVQQQTR